MFAQGDWPITNGAPALKPLAQGGQPLGVLPCVWMSAGLVAFKLCDREGECEGCPFDRAMQGARRPEPLVSSPDIPSLDAGPASRPLPPRAGRRTAARP